jgi:hypothetical protein
LPQFSIFSTFSWIVFFRAHILKVCEILLKILMCICSVRIPSLEYSLFTWNLSIFRHYLAVFSHWIYSTPLWQNLLTLRSTVVFCLFYICVVCILNIFNLQLESQQILPQWK